MQFHKKDTLIQKRGRIATSRSFSSDLGSLPYALLHFDNLVGLGGIFSNVM